MEEQEIRAQRLEKLARLRARGIDPFALERYDRTANTVNALDSFRLHEEHPEERGPGVGTFFVEGAAAPHLRLGGRMISSRHMGKASFAHLQDEHSRIQIYVRREDLGEQAYADFLDLDIGDLLGVEGFLFRTRTGEITIHVKSYTLLAKCLRPLPIGKEREGEHFSDLSDVELRHRRRYLDLIAHQEVRTAFAHRSAIITEIRQFLNDRLYMEVETPVLQAIAGGAAARPFTTHHNALDEDFKLRISLELYLKRLIVGGFDRVYEIGRVFRNEGVSTRHNPEFTLLELYEAYTDLDGMMELVEAMYARVCQAVHGREWFTWSRETPDGVVEEKIDFSIRPWRRLPILEGIAEFAGVRPEEFDTLESAKAACERVGIPSEREHTIGGIIEKLHERFTQPNLVQPTFVTEFPIETSPLAKKKPGDPRLTRRFEVYMATQELGNAFSEINDPIDQRERFENQMVQRAAGDDEAHPMDEDFLRALEYGMPPTGGLGVGIDRLAMVLTGVPSIREIILFPLLRPEK